MPRPGGLSDPDEHGFTLIEVVMAMLVLVTVAFSLTFVLVSSLADTAYARQRSEATNLANETIEEVRALPWTTIEQGMNPVSSPDPTFTQDPNITGGDCFEGIPIDIGSIVGTQACSSVGWQDPTCLTQTITATPPVAQAISSPAPISPHQACYRVGVSNYAVDVYITGTTNGTTPTSYLAGTTTTPLTATVVVSWAHPFRNGLSDHVVTTTELTSCTKGDAQCS
jgi:prepilin-type N-terminal cleavage/methylation domain-containing protein